jgi:hypothetical protein
LSIPLPLRDAPMGYASAQKRVAQFAEAVAQAQVLAV